MPIELKDYTWKQTDEKIILTVPLQGVCTSKVDVFVSEEVVKICQGPYIFELFLKHEIDDLRTVVTITDNEVILTLYKKDCSMWDCIEANLNRNERREAKVNAVNNAAVKSQQMREARRRLQAEQERFAVSEAIDFDAQRRNCVQQQRDEERNAAMTELDRINVLRLIVTNESEIVIESNPEGIDTGCIEFKEDLIINVDNDGAFITNNLPQRETVHERADQFLNDVVNECEDTLNRNVDYLQIDAQDSLEISADPCPGTTPDNNGFIIPRITYSLASDNEVALTERSPTNAGYTPSNYLSPEGGYGSSNYFLSPTETGSGLTNYRLAPTQSLKSDQQCTPTGCCYRSSSCQLTPTGVSSEGYESSPVASSPGSPCFASSPMENLQRPQLAVICEEDEFDDEMLHAINKGSGLLDDLNKNYLTVDQQNNKPDSKYSAFFKSPQDKQPVASNEECIDENEQAIFMEPEEEQSDVYCEEDIGEYVIDKTGNVTEQFANKAVYSNLCQQLGIEITVDETGCHTREVVNRYTDCSAEAESQFFDDDSLFGTPTDNFVVNEIDLENVLVDDNQGVDAEIRIQSNMNDVVCDEDIFRYSEVCRENILDDLKRVSAEIAIENRCQNSGAIYYDKLCEMCITDELKQLNTDIKLDTAASRCEDDYPRRINYCEDEVLGDQNLFDEEQDAYCIEYEYERSRIKAEIEIEHVNKFSDDNYLSAEVDDFSGQMFSGDPNPVDLAIAVENTISEFCKDNIPNCLNNTSAQFAVEHLNVYFGENILLDKNQVNALFEREGFCDENYLDDSNFLNAETVMENFESSLKNICDNNRLENKRRAINLDINLKGVECNSEVGVTGLDKEGIRLALNNEHCLDVESISEITIGYTEENVPIESQCDGNDSKLETLINEQKCLLQDHIETTEKEFKELRKKIENCEKLQKDMKSSTSLGSGDNSSRSSGDRRGSLKKEPILKLKTNFAGPKPLPNKVEKPLPNKIDKQLPNKVEKPLSNKVEKPIPNKVEKPLTNKVEKPFPNKIEKPQINKVEKPQINKVEKPLLNKVEKPLLNKPATATSNSVSNKCVPNKSNLTKSAAEPTDLKKDCITSTSPKKTQASEPTELKKDYVTSTSPKKTQVEKDNKRNVPPPRKFGTINFSLTDRSFPTPKRESCAKNEEEWLKNVTACKRATGFASEDLRPEEQDPTWCKEKGDEFYRCGNHLGAISAYSHGIKLCDSMATLYSNRAACHLAVGNYEKCIDDCSSALDLLKPVCPANSDVRAKCIARRAVALTRVGMLSKGIDEMQAACNILPNNCQLQDDLCCMERVWEQTPDCDCCDYCNCCD